MTAMNGVHVISKVISSAKTKLNTSFLSSGTYIWQIITRNKVIESGKWVKE